MSTEYVGAAYVVDEDGNETVVRAALRVDADGWWGGNLIGSADWLGIAGSTEPFAELRLPNGRSRPFFVSEFDRATTIERVATRASVRSRGDADCKAHRPAD